MSSRRFAKLELPESVLQLCRNRPFDIAIQAPIMYDHDVNWEDFSAFVTCASTDGAADPGPTVRAPRGRAQATTINTINATQSTHRTRTTST